MKLERQRKKNDGAQHLRKSGQLRRVQKVPKMTPKGFGFDKNLNYSCVLFFMCSFFRYESTNGYLTFCKNHMSGKNLTLEFFGQKPLD